jgi:hypothetical protein
MRALAAEVRFSIVRDLNAEVALHVFKSVPQRLKPSRGHGITARLNPCPSFRAVPFVERFFPSRDQALKKTGWLRWDLLSF